MNAELRIWLGRWRERLNEILSPCGISISSSRESHSITVCGLVGWALEGLPQVTFVQIGVNDGRRGDALRGLRRQRSWSGVVIEPNPLVLDQLRKNTRAEPSTKILHAALGFEDGEREFFFIPKGGVKGRVSKVASHLGSFSREQVQKSVGYLSQQNCEALQIESTRVATISWETLLQSNDLKSPDLVALDTEGYDVELLGAFPFDMTTPSVIVFEYMWSYPSELEQLRERLEGYSYILFPTGHDCICVHDRCFRRKSRWQYLQG